MSFILGLIIGLFVGYYFGLRGFGPVIADAKALLARLRRKP